MVGTSRTFAFGTSFSANSACATASDEAETSGSKQYFVAIGSNTCVGRHENVTRGTWELVQDRRQGTGHGRAAALHHRYGVVRLHILRDQAGR